MSLATGKGTSDGEDARLTILLFLDYCIQKIFNANQKILSIGMFIVFLWSNQRLLGMSTIHSLIFRTLNNSQLN